MAVKKIIANESNNCKKEIVEKGPFRLRCR